MPRREDISESFYQKGEMWIENGVVINELGNAAKGRDIVLRHPTTGFPLKRFCEFDFSARVKPYNRTDDNSWDFGLSDIADIQEVRI